MSVLKYNTYTLTPTPTLSIDEDPLGKPDGAQQAFRETWRIRGDLLGSQSELISKAIALQNAFAADGGDLTLYRDDGVTVMRQLLNSGCADGVRVIRAPSFPDLKGAAFATFLPYEIMVSGVKMRADAPGANAWGEKTVTRATEADGSVRVMVQGQYSGAGAQAAADAAKLSTDVIVVREAQTTSDAESAVRFAYEYLDTSNSRAVRQFTETVRQQTAASRKVFRYQLGGGQPTRQTTVLSESRGSQSGSAVGIGAYPDFPDPVWSSADYAESPVKEKQSPKRGADGGAWEYPIRWEYQFAWSTPVPSFPDPNTPPTGA